MKIRLLSFLVKLMATGSLLCFFLNFLQLSNSNGIFGFRSTSFSTSFGSKKEEQGRHIVTA